VCALIFHSVLKLSKSAVVDIPTVILFCAVLAASAFFGLSPVLLVVCAGAVGLSVRFMKGWKA
jgi:chromate transporter